MPVRPSSPRGARRGRMTGGAVALIGALLVTIVVVFGYLAVASTASQFRDQRPRDLATSRQRFQEFKRAGDVEGYVTQVLAAGRRDASRNRPQSLRPMIEPDISTPNAEAFRQLVAPVAEAPKFVPALARRAAQFGRPAFVTAVSMLQELDYRDGLDCQRAMNLQQMLVQMTDIKTLTIEMSGREPSPQETCMFHAIAGGWRGIAEDYAATDDAYREMVSRGASRGGQTRRSLRRGTPR